MFESFPHSKRIFFTTFFKKKKNLFDVCRRLTTKKTPSFTPVAWFNGKSQWIKIDQLGRHFHLLLKPQKENRSQNSVAIIRNIERGYSVSRRLVFPKLDDIINVTDFSGLFLLPCTSRWLLIFFGLSTASWRASAMLNLGSLGEYGRNVWHPALCLWLYLHVRWHFWQ